MSNNHYADLDKLIKEYEEDTINLRSERLVMKNYPKVLTMSAASSFEYNIKNAPIQGVMYQDPRNKNQTLIRTYAGVNLERLSNAENINLRRKDDILYINGVEFKLRHLQRGEGQEEINAKCLVETNRDYGKEIENIAQKLNSRISEVEKNMFLTVTDRSQISKIAVELRKRIALTRVDIEKIYSQNELSL